jgi:hypothetical protein
VGESVRQGTKDILSQLDNKYGRYVFGAHAWHLDLVQSV